MPKTRVVIGIEVDPSTAVWTAEIRAVNGGDLVKEFLDTQEAVADAKARDYIKCRDDLELDG